MKTTVTAYAHIVNQEDAHIAAVIDSRAQVVLSVGDGPGDTGVTVFMSREQALAMGRELLRVAELFQVSEVAA